MKTATITYCPSCGNAEIKMIEIGHEGSTGCSRCDQEALTVGELWTAELRHKVEKQLTKARELLK